MGVMPAEAYRSQLAALLPRGLPWPQDPATLLQRLLLAWADALARVDARAWALLDEADPRTTPEMLGEWERAFGLPDPCIEVAGASDAARRAALVARVVGIGGQRPADFIALAAAIGRTITITEYRAWRADCRVDRRCCGLEWAHVWSASLGAAAVFPFRANSRADVRMASWATDAAVECLLRRAAPAHTVVLFNYGGGA